MRSWFSFSVVLLGLLALSACGDDGRPAGTAGNDSTLVGGACMSNTECDKGLCQAGEAFPGSLCTISCGGSNNCPSGSSCVELDSGWVCLVDCMATTDCREQWTCEPIIEAGTNGGSTVSVCIGPVPTS